MVGYSIVSIVGIMIMILGFGMAKQDPIFLWTPPAGMLHLTALFVLIAAAYVPRNHIRARLHHPMILGVQAWAFGHLLANDTLADVILFGSFLIWASLSFKAARQRDQINGVSYGLGSITRTSISIIVGFIMWLAFVLKLHAMLIGIVVVK